MGTACPSDTHCPSLGKTRPMPDPPPSPKPKQGLMSRPPPKTKPEAPHNSAGLRPGCRWIVNGRAWPRGCRCVVPRHGPLGPRPCPHSRAGDRTEHDKCVAAFGRRGIRVSHISRGVSGALGDQCSWRGTWAPKGPGAGGGRGPGRAVRDSKTK